MLFHKTWYSIVVALLGLLFVSTSVRMFLYPKEMIPSLLSGFDTGYEQLGAFFVIKFIWGKANQ